MYLIFQEENDNLRCQLEAYKNEIDILKSEMQCDIDSKVHDIHQFQAKIAMLETQLTQAKRAQASESVKLLAMEAKLNAKEKMKAAEKCAFDLKKIKDDKEIISKMEKIEKVCIINDILYRVER